MILAEIAFWDFIFIKGRVNMKEKEYLKLKEKIEKDYIKRLHKKIRCIRACMGNSKRE